MPFGSAASIDWGALPPLDDTTKPSAGPAASFADLGLENSLLQPSKQPVKQLYKLALVDADGGLRIPTDAELQVCRPPPPRGRRPARSRPAHAPCAACAALARACSSRSRSCRGPNQPALPPLPQALITGARLPASPPPPPVRAQPAPAAQQQPGAREPTFQELLAATAKQGGPVCAHCGVT